jgi:hypothetical protein
MEPEVKNNELVNEEVQPKRRGRKPKAVVEAKLSATKEIESNTQKADEISSEDSTVDNKQSNDTVEISTIEKSETLNNHVSENESSESKIRCERLKLSKPLTVYKFKSTSSDKHILSGEATFKYKEDSNWVEVSGIGSVGYIRGYILKTQ